MNQRLTRRQLAQLAIASSAAAAIGTLASKTFAQQPNLVIVGVNSGPLTSTDSTAVPEVDSTEQDNPTAATTTTVAPNRGLVLQSLDVVTGQIQNLTDSLVQNLRTPLLQPNTTSTLQVGERIADLTALADGTLVMAINPISSSNIGASPTRLTFMGTSPTSVTVSGLNKNEAVQSLLALKDGSLIALVAQRNGRPPARVVNIDSKTGAISNNVGFTLPTDVRYNNLAQCPDGIIYTTSVGREGDTYLVQLDQAHKQPITLAQLRIKNGSVWNNGLFSLTCSPAGQLFALGAFWHETTKYVYTVDAKTGEMTPLTAFSAARITSLPASLLTGIL